MITRSSAARLSLFVVVLALVVLSIHPTHRERKITGFSSANPPIQPGLSSYPEADNAGRHEYGRKQEEPGQEREYCQSLGLACVSKYFGSWREPSAGACSTSVRNGYPLPDPVCTPGGINTGVNLDLIRGGSFRTGCTRNCESSESGKHKTYSWYGLRAPRVNSGDNQTCELDHLVPLELGGADGLGNIWPECGPGATVLDERYFKIKDRVEGYLTGEVKAGRMSLEDAQRGIALDWTQYVLAADRHCQALGHC